MRIHAAVGAVLLVGGAAAADEPDADRTHRFPSTAVHTTERAGHPQAISRWAVPSRSPHHGGGYVGGGKLSLFAAHRDGRDPHTEGTWGWDFVGRGRRPGRVFLGWWHGRPHEPAAAPYRTDAAHYFDPLTVRPLKRIAEVGKPADGHH